MLSELKLVLGVAVALLMTGWLAFGGTETVSADSATAFAGGGTGTLSVSVQNTSGGRVAGANVVVFDDSSNVAGQATTGPTGKTAFPGLANGDYTVFASKVEYVFGFPIGMFGTASATVSGGVTGVIVVLDQFTY